MEHGFYDDVKNKVVGKLIFYSPYTAALVLASCFDDIYFFLMVNDHHFAIEW